MISETYLLSPTFLLIFFRLYSFLMNINVYGLCLLKEVPLENDKVSQVSKINTM